MKYVTFLVIIALAVCAFAGGDLEDTKKLLSSRVLLKIENTTLKNVLDAITSQRDIKFVYSKEFGEKKVPIFIANRIELQDALEQLLGQFNLTFVPQEDGTVLIKKALAKSVLRGKVVDIDNNDPIPFANVFLKNSDYGSSTDEKGKYEIKNIKPGVYSLAVRVIGFDTTSIKLNLESGKVFEQNFKLKSQTIQMQEIVKIAEAEKRVFQPQISAFTIDIRQSNLVPSYGEKDIYRTLQMMPGVVVTNDFKSQLYVRGGNSDQNLVMIDGGIAYNPFHFSGILTAFDVDAIDSVSFYTGGFGAEYGGRLSSVLDIQTRKGSNKYSGILSGSPLSAKLLLEGPIWGENRFLITGRQSFISGVSEKMGDRVVPDFFDGIARLDFAKSKNENIKLSSFLGRDKVKMKEGGSGEYLTSTNLTSAFEYLRTFSNRGIFSMGANFGLFKTKIPPPATVENPQENNLSDVSVKLQYDRLSQGKFSWKFGAESHMIAVDYTSFDPIITEYVVDKTLYEAAVFLQTTYKHSEKWNFFPGLRVNYYTSDSPVSIEPRLSARYYLYNFLYFNLSVGRFSQNMVTIYNENDTYNPVDIWLPPEENMKPAIADHFIAGVTYDLPKFILSSEIYFKNYNNLTHYNRERLEEGDPFFVQGKGYSYGFDISLQLLRDTWQIMTNYSFGIASKELYFKYPEPGVDKFHPRYDRRHNINFVSEWEPIRSLNISLGWTLSSGLPFSYMYGAYERLSGWVIDKDYDYITHHPEELYYYLTALTSERDAFRYPWYHRMDLSVRYNLKWKRFELTPFLQIINLYDRPNVLYYDVHGDPYASVPFIFSAGGEFKF